MKVHLGVDKNSGLIHSVVTTSATVHDLTPAAEPCPIRQKASSLIWLKRPKLTKKQFGFQKTRLRGMAKNRCKVNVIPALANLFLARRQLLMVT